MERGQRQYALFAGLNKEGSACGHVSENGGSSFLCRYALHKCNSVEVLDRSWQCFAMTFDHKKRELTGWLNGVSGERWLENPQKDNLLSFAANAWKQGHQPGADPSYPPDQYYTPPEGKPRSVTPLPDSAELHEFGYTRVKVTRQTRELAALRLNPWWYSHGIYTPKDATSGGPFTIGRVIHSSRSVGFTGWIGGVAVYNRALSTKELAALADLRKEAR